MTDLIVTIVRELVTDQESIQVTKDEINENDVIVYHLTVSPEDTGRVIGKQGKIAKSIRAILRASGYQKGVKVALEID